MDLKRYIESEIEEEAQRAIVAPPSATAHADGYAGDPAVHVGHDEVVVERLRLAEDGFVQEAYLARPRRADPAPAVVVVHENKGLVPYIENVVRRLALHGYVAVAPDLLSRVGGTPSFAQPADVPSALSGIDGAMVVGDVRRLLARVAERDDVVADRLAIVGFCYGGGVAWRVLTEEPRLTVGIPFYGPIPDLDAVAGIRAPVLAVYAELDERITSMLPTISKAMSRHRKRFESIVLENAQHAFHNDTNAVRYHPAAAAAAWAAAVEWLDHWLRGE
jgi:carboxymethylenebutenolidase